MTPGETRTVRFRDVTTRGYRGSFRNKLGVIQEQQGGRVPPWAPAHTAMCTGASVCVPQPILLMFSWPFQGSSQHGIALRGYGGGGIQRALVISVFVSKYVHGGRGGIQGDVIQATRVILQSLTVGDSACPPA